MNGQYKLIGKLGRGGMADVFLAVTRGPGGFTKLQVVKKLHAQFEEMPELVAMFLDEARLAAVLSHPNICQTHEVGHEANSCFMVMEYLEGLPFYAVLRRCAEKSKPLPLSLHLRVLAEVLDALHYAHEKKGFDGNPLGIVHRDISPHNVFVVYDAGVKLLDFGIAKATTSSTDTRTGILKGKIRCLAPEQVAGKRIDRRTDIFQVGLMLFEAVTNRPFWPKTLAPTKVVSRLFTGDLPEVQDRDAPDAPDLVPVLRRALAFRPEDRYSTAEELRTELEGAIRRRGTPVAARGVGAWAATLFAEERKKQRRGIEEALRALPPDAKPVAQLLAPAQFGSFTRLNAVPNSLALTRDDTFVDMPKLIDAGIDDSTTPDAGIDVEVVPDSVGDLTPSGDARSTHLGENGRTRRLAVIVALATAGLALTVTVLWLTVLSQAPPAGPVAQPLPPVPASNQHSAVIATVAASVPQKTPDRVRIRIRASPARAKLFLDDVPQSVNPVVTHVQADSRPHKVRAAAPGFVGEEKHVVFDTDREVTFDLTRASAAARQGRPPPRPEATPPAPRPAKPSLRIREDR